jgi:hypothetical protein
LLAVGVVGAMAAEWPVTDQQRDQARQIAGSGVALADLASNAPPQYTVKTGDTLWGISTLFLKSPWRWPDLWGMNLEQVHNPHLIYPGQSLVLIRTPDGRAHLQVDPVPDAGISVPESASVVPGDHLGPRVRDLGNAQSAAIPSIPNNLIEPFLARPQILTEEQANAAARIVAAPDDRVLLGVGDTAYARGLAADVPEHFNVLRPARPLYEPDDLRHRHPIAYESVFLGTARLLRRDDVSSLQITSSVQEMSLGDRLVPVDHQPLVNYAPHRLADPAFRARIVSAYAGLQAVGANSIVALDRGSQQGLEVGHVLAVYHGASMVTDSTSADHDRIVLPNQRVGLLFVFRVFASVSYGLLMSANGPVQVGDWLTSPDLPVTLLQP